MAPSSACAYACAAVLPRPRLSVALLTVSMATALLLTTALADVGTFVGPQALVAAINQANTFAKATGGAPNTFGRTVTLTLRTSVKLTRSLPPMAATASLTIMGRCSKAGRPSLCVIDAGGRFSVFSSPPGTGAASRVTLQSLTFRNAEGGVFLDLFSVISATSVAFLNNSGGVDLSTALRPGGYPPRYYTGCTFAGNRGGVIAAGDRQYGLATLGVGYRVRSCTFRGNTGASVVRLAGRGYSLFDRVTFAQNTAPTSGGALNLESTTVFVANSSFTGNRVTAGSGAAIYGLSNQFGAVGVGVCTTTFTDNHAPQAPVGKLITVESPSGIFLPGSAAYGAFRMCGSTLPTGAEQVSYPSSDKWSVSIQSSRCAAGSCTH